MAVHVNKSDLPEQQIAFMRRMMILTAAAPAFRPLMEQLGLKTALHKGLAWWHQGECLDEASLKGMEIRGDLATSSLYLSIPQAYLDYVSEDWDPPSRWEMKAFRGC